MRVVWVLSGGLTDPWHSPFPTHTHAFLLVPEHTVNNSLDLWTQRTQVADKVKHAHIKASMKYVGAFKLSRDPPVVPQSMFILIHFQIALSLAVSPEWLGGPVLVAVCKHSPQLTQMK